MFKLLGYLLAPRIAVAVIGLLLAMGWQAWIVVRPRSLPLDEARLELARDVAERLAERLPQPDEGKPTLAVARFEWDAGGQVTELVREAVARQDRFFVQPNTLWQNIRRELGLEEPALAIDDWDAVPLESFGADFVLAGRIAKLRHGDAGPEAALDAVLIPAAAPDRATPLSVAVGSNASNAPGAEQAVSAYPWPARLLSWLAMSLLLPLAFIPLTQRGLERESNVVNLGMLLGLTIVSSVAAYAMLDFRLDTPWSAGILVAAVAAALSYNWAVLARLENLRL